MFILKEGQYRPKPTIVIKYSSKLITTGDMMDHFKRAIYKVQREYEFNEKSFKSFFGEKNLDKTFQNEISFNSNKTFNNNDYVINYNITRHKRNRNLNLKNGKYGVIVYIYITEKNKVNKVRQNSTNFVLEFKTGAVVNLFNKENPAPFIFKMKKGKESFYVKTIQEKKFLENDGFSSDNVLYVEANGKYFEVVREIKNEEFKVIDTLSDKIKIFKTQKEAKLSGREFFPVEMNGISGKNYFTKDFTKEETGFFKIYGEVEGYVLVEKVVSILEGAKTVITFIKKNDKVVIEKIKSLMPVIDWI